MREGPRVTVEAYDSGRTSPVVGPVAWVERGHVRFAAAQYAEAVEDYGRALQLNPNDATAYLWRGCAWGHLGKYAASADLTKAAQLDPNGPAGEAARKLLQ